MHVLLGRQALCLLRCLCLGFGACDLELVCYLVLVIWSFSSFGAWDLPACRQVWNWDSGFSIHDDSR
jgi:hypothetical protein